MRIGNITIKRRVWVGLASALIVTVAWWAWMRVNPPHVAAAATAKSPFVRLAVVGAGKNDEVLREQAMLFDPTPLFFPTEWNYGQGPLRASVERQPGNVFPSFEAKLIFTDPNMKPYGAEESLVPASLTDALVQGNQAPLAGFGQVDGDRHTLSERSGYLEVRVLGVMKPIIAQALNGFTTPKQDFSPLEFLVVVSSAGVVGEPVLTSGSGWDEVDTFFRSYLVQTYRIGERLRPGRYQVAVGP